jgi:hypothetical protein
MHVAVKTGQISYRGLTGLMMLALIFSFIVSVIDIGT